MFEPTRFTPYTPDLSGRTARVPAAEELVFETMVMEALASESLSSDSADGPAQAFLPVGTMPALGTTGGFEPMNPGRRTGKTAGASVDLVSRPPQALSAYREAVAGVAGPAQERQDSPSRHQFVEWLDRHALTRSVHKCAKFVRQALEAAGMSTADRPSSGAAGDYGPYLLRHGAAAVEADAHYRPEAGDTAVFEKTAEHPFGHIEVFDGERWVSDFRQSGFSPYRDPATTPAFQVYRLP